MKKGKEGQEGVRQKSRKDLELDQAAYFVQIAFVVFVIVIVSEVLDSHLSSLFCFNVISRWATIFHFHVPLVIHSRIFTAR